MFIPTDLLTWSVQEGLATLGPDEQLFVALLAFDIDQAMQSSDEETVGMTVEGVVREMGAPSEVWLIANLTGRLAHRVSHLSEN